MSKIVDLKRRNFLKGSAAAAAAASVASTSAFAGSYDDAKNLKQQKEEDIKNAKYTASICGMCVNMCGVIVRNVDGKITKVDPNPLHTKSRGFMCARGNAGLAAEYDPDRITKPLKRVGPKGSGKFEEISWEQALEEISQKMVKILDEERDNRSTFVFGAGASTGNMGDPVFANFLNGVGSANFIDHFTTCFAPSFMANLMTFGSWGLSDFQHTKYILNLGANRAEGIVTPDTLDMFRHTHGRGIEKIVYIDPRYTNTASHCDEFIAIKPGTDLALMLAMIHETINKGYHKTPYKSKYIAENVDGMDELEEFFLKGEATKYTPEWAEKITDIPASTIRRLTKEFSDAAEKYEGAANCYRSRKSTWYYQDYEFRRAQAILNSIHGCVNRPGGVTLGTKLKGKNGKTIESYEYEDFPIYDNAKGRIDTGTIADGQYPLANPTKGSWQILRDTILEVNTKWDKAGRPKPDADGNYKGLSENEYPVRGFFIYKQNPMQSVPDYDKTAEMLKSVDLVVTIDIVANDTAYYSDYILPDITYIERESLVKHFGTNEPFIVWRSAAKEPEGESKHIYYMCNELTKRIEKPFADITFKYTWEPDDESLKLPKDFKITKYLNEDFEVEEAKLKADIKDEKLVNAIVEHAGEDGLDIATYKITEAFKESIPEFNKRVMSETFGEEAAKIAKEYGVYWPGIEDVIKSGVMDTHLKQLKVDYQGKNTAIYDLYAKYSKLPKDYYIAKKKGKWIKLSQRNIDGKKMKSPLTGKTEILGKFPKWRDSLFQAPDTDKGELRVVLGRYAYFTQSAQPNNYLLLDLMNYNYVWINDEFAKKRGLKFKDEVVLTNKDGKKVKAKVFPTKRIRKDTAYIATGFGSKSKMLSLGYDNGVSQAEICDNSIDPIIGSASMNETIITIEKV
jgi:thiosulfate reductase/polysulfide reductase chain A